MGLEDGPVSKNFREVHLLHQPLTRANLSHAGPTRSWSVSHRFSASFSVSQNLQVPSLVRDQAGNEAPSVPGLFLLVPRPGPPLGFLVYHLPPQNLF